MIMKCEKDPTLPESYRPISLLSNLSKVAGTIILSRHRDPFSEGDFLPNEYFGFREGLSTDFQPLRLTEEVRNAFELRHSTSAVFVGFTSVFGSVWHDGPELVAFIGFGKSFRMKSYGDLSAPRYIKVRVAQGSFLRPELFIYYTNAIPCYPSTRLAFHADDTSMFTSFNKNGLTCRRLQRWTTSASGWRLSINSSKCEVIRYS